VDPCYICSALPFRIICPEFLVFNFLKSWQTDCNVPDRPQRCYPFPGRHHPDPVPVSFDFLQRSLKTAYNLYLLWNIVIMTVYFISFCSFWEGPVEIPTYSASGAEAARVVQGLGGQNPIPFTTKVVNA
jgi:hypothetical protein